MRGSRKYVCRHSHDPDRSDGDGKDIDGAAIGRRYHLGIEAKR